MLPASALALLGGMLWYVFRDAHVVILSVPEGGVLLLCACGFSLPDALFEFASALGTVGLSSGITAAYMPEAVLNFSMSTRTRFGHWPRRRRTHSGYSF